MRILRCLVWLTGVSANYEEYEHGVLRGDCLNIKGSKECVDNCIDRAGDLEKVPKGCAIISGPITGWHIGDQWNKYQESEWMELNTKDIPKGCDSVTSKCETAEDCQSWCNGTVDCAWFSWFIRGATNVLHRCQGKSEKQLDAALLVDSTNSCANVPLRCLHSTCLWHYGTLNTCVWRAQNIVGGTLEQSESLMYRFERINKIHLNATNPATPYDSHTPILTDPTDPDPADPSKFIDNPGLSVGTDKPTPSVQPDRTEPPTNKPTVTDEQTIPTDKPTTPDGTVPTAAMPQTQDTPTTKASGTSTGTKVGAIAGAAGGVAIIGAGAYAAVRVLGSGAPPPIEQSEFAEHGTNETSRVTRESAMQLDEANFI